MKVKIINALMKERYLKYSINELIEDSDFIAYVLKNSNSELWDTFIKGHPVFSIKANKAKSFIRLLHDPQDNISQQEISSIWQEIDTFYEIQKGKKSSVFVPRIFFRYAAIFILLIGLLGIGYEFIINLDSGFRFDDLMNMKTGNNIQLILADGRRIDIDGKSSIMTIDQGGKGININNETIVQFPSLIDNNYKSQYNEVYVPLGKKSIIELEDGSKIWLNTGSRIAFPVSFSNKKREVYLTGEAFFSVAHDESKPFYVKTRGLTVKVLGTSFNVCDYRDDTEIKTLLVEGKIAISRNRNLNIINEEIILSPKEMAIFSKESRTMTLKDETDTEFYEAMVKGYLSFSKESIFNIINKLERFYNVKFFFNSSFLSDDIISGKLDLKVSISDVMATLSGLIEISYNIDNDSIYIGKKLK